MSELLWAGAVLCRGRQLLLARRSARRSLYPDVWDVPGGHAEDGEDASDALRRELWEELGVRPTKWELLAHADVAVGDRTADYQIFLVRSWTGEPANRSPHEHSEILWFSFEEAAALDLVDPAYRDVFAQVPTLMTPS